MRDYEVTLVKTVNYVNKLVVTAESEDMAYNFADEESATLMLGWEADDTLIHIIDIKPKEETNGR